MICPRCNERATVNWCDRCKPCMDAEAEQLQVRIAGELVESYHGTFGIRRHTAMSKASAEIAAKRDDRTESEVRERADQ